MTTVNEAAGKHGAHELARTSLGCESSSMLSRVSSERTSGSDLSRVSAGRDFFRTTSGRLLHKIKRHVPGTHEYMDKSDEIACGLSPTAIPEGAALTAQEAGGPSHDAASDLSRSSGGQEAFRTTSGRFLSKLKRHLPGTTEYMEKSDEIQSGSAGAAPEHAGA